MRDLAGKRNIVPDTPYRFSRRVDNYVKYRPRYPQAILDTLFHFLSRARSGRRYLITHWVVTGMA